MAAFRRFDPYAVLAETDGEGTLAALAGLAGVRAQAEDRERASAEDNRDRRVLAPLATLAGVAAKIENPATSCFRTKVASSEENQDRRGTPAKVANPAKVAEPETAPSLGAADENRDRGGDPAKAANVAKVVEPAAAPSWGEAEAERAAIVEHDGGVPRAWADGFARLDPGRPPRDVPLKRWLRFVDDVSRFLDSPFCAAAQSLGWGPFDFFGCDSDKPFARIDLCGVLWLLNGDKLVELTATTATIETRTGERHRWCRKPSAPGRVLAWDLVQ